MNLQLSLKRKWFELSDTPNGKPEDYREITPYWAKRLLLSHGQKLSKCLSDLEIEALCEEIINANNCCVELDEEVDFVLDNYYSTFSLFENNIMTLGYPKSGDTSRIKIFEHAGIEIRTGNPEFGAEPNKLYFVIKHGKRIQ